MSSGGTIDPLAEIQQHREKYIKDTHYFNDYNEIYNLNTHLLDANTLEQQKLYRVNEQIKTKLMKMKQDYMLTDHSIHELSMYSNILAFTILAVCVLLTFVSKATAESKNTLIMICAIIGILYLIIVIVILKSNSNRRSYSWGQWYWSPMKQKQ